MQINKLQRQFILSTTSPYPQKAINKGDYTLVHYLIFIKLVSAEAHALKNLYLKTGSTSSNLRLVSKWQWCLTQMPEVVCVFSKSNWFLLAMLQSCIRSGLPRNIFPRYDFAACEVIQECTYCITAEMPLHSLF